MSNVPLFKTWQQWYAFAIVMLLAIIGFFIWFTNYFA
jgi:hypothetical protein